MKKNVLILILFFTSSVSLGQEEKSVVVDLSIGKAMGGGSSSNPESLLPDDKFELTFTNFDPTKVIDIGFGSEVGFDSNDLKSLFNGSDSKKLQYDGDQIVTPAKKLELPFTLVIKYSGGDIKEVKFGSGEAENEEDDQITIDEKLKEPFYDAIGLKEGVDREVILRKYMPTPKENETNGREEAQTHYSENPFISPYFSDLWPSSSDASAQSEGGGSVEANAAGTAKSFINPTYFLDALGTFIAKRLKEELNVAYLSKFRDSLKVNTNFKTLLPHTHNTLVYSDVFKYKSFFPTLRESFHTDFNELLINVPEVMQLPENKKKIIREIESDGYILLLSYLEVFRVIKDEEHASKLFERIHNSEYLKTADVTNISSSLRLIAIFSENLKPRVGKGWITSTDLSKLKDPKTLQLFLGLVYENNIRTEDSKIQFDGKTLAEILSESSSRKLNDFVSLSYDFIETIEDVNEIIENNNKKEDSLTLSDYKKYLIAIKKSVLITTQFSGFAENAELSSKLKNRVLPAVESSIMIFDELDKKNYPKVVSNATDLVSTLFASDTSFMKGFLEFSSFMANVVEADTSTQMLTALEQIADPVQSYRFKRQHKFSVSINSFAGGFIGHEFENIDPDLDVSNDTKLFNTVGFTAPVGIAINWGAFSNRAKNDENANGSFSLFFPIIDVGAITSFRLQDESLSLPDLTFKNVLAPGLYTVWGIPKSPLAFGVGAQFGPELRSIEVKDQMGVIKNVEASAWRMGAFISVDIPIKNLYGRSKRSKIPTSKHKSSVVSRAQLLNKQTKKFNTSDFHQVNDALELIMIGKDKAQDIVVRLRLDAEESPEQVNLIWEYSTLEKNKWTSEKFSVPFNDADFDPGKISRKEYEFDGLDDKKIKIENFASTHLDGIAYSYSGTIVFEEGDSYNFMAQTDFIDPAIVMRCMEKVRNKLKEKVQRVKDYVASLKK